jgi:hypothetical protein
MYFLTFYSKSLLIQSVDHNWLEVSVRGKSVSPGGRIILLIPVLRTLQCCEIQAKNENVPFIQKYLRDEKGDI